MSRSVADLSPDQLARAREYFEYVLSGNKSQNLTRITTWEEFCDHNLRDVMELLDLVDPDARLMDLGSGAGVPGVLCALLRKQDWILVEAETSKADFLTSCVKEFKLDCQVLNLRAEKAVMEVRVDAIVSRAVGSLSKIYRWIEPCSTWNSLILLKTDRFSKEWRDFKRLHGSDALDLVERRTYSQEPTPTKREIVVLRRK